MRAIELFRLFPEWPSRDDRRNIISGLVGGFLESWSSPVTQFEVTTLKMWSGVSLNLKLLQEFDKVQFVPRPV